MYSTNYYEEPTVDHSEHERLLKYWEEEMKDTYPNISDEELYELYDQNFEKWCDKLKSELDEIIDYCIV